MTDSIIRAVLFRMKGAALFMLPDGESGSLCVRNVNFAGAKLFILHKTYPRVLAYSLIIYKQRVKLLTRCEI